jgi:nitrate/nitrite transporter NarK
MMTVYWASTYFVRTEKREEFLAAMKKQKEYIAKNRKEFKEIKSWRLYTQIYGGTFMSFIEMWEYDSMAACDKYESEWFHGGRLAEFGAAYVKLVEGGTMSSLIWKPELELE